MSLDAKPSYDFSYLKQLEEIMLGMKSWNARMLGTGDADWEHVEASIASEAARTYALASATKYLSFTGSILVEVQGTEAYAPIKLYEVTYEIRAKVQAKLPQS